MVGAEGSIDCFNMAKVTKEQTAKINVSCFNSFFLPVAHWL